MFGKLSFLVEAIAFMYTILSSSRINGNSSESEKVQLVASLATNLKSAGITTVSTMDFI